MRINGKEIKYSERLTLGQMEYLEERYENLENQINRKFDLDIYIEKSRLSEAAYFYFYTDEDTENEEYHEFSIRNHQNLESTQSLTSFWIAEFNNWNALKKSVFEKVESALKGGK